MGRKSETSILTRIPKTGPARAPARPPAGTLGKPQGKSADLADLAEQKARLVKEQADRAARINAREAGELLDADRVESEWASICTAIRSAMLAVPARVAMEHPGNPALVATVDREIRAALAALADSHL